MSGQNIENKEDEVTNENENPTPEAEVETLDASEGVNEDAQPKAEEKPKAKRGPKPKKAQDEPSVGRIVHYVTASGSIRPAIISRVSDDAVDVTLFNSQGAVPVNDVSFDPEFPGETPGTVFWPERR